VVGVETVDLVEHVREELVAPLEYTDGMKRLPSICQHVIKSITCQLFNSVLDHSIWYENIANRVLIMVGDAEEAGLVPCTQKNVE
jgi:hypothetical protein